MPAPQPRSARLKAMSADIVDVEGAATLLGVSMRTIYKLAAAGSLPGTKIGKEWRFARKKLIEWVANGGQVDPANQSLEALLKNRKVRVLHKR